jgi:hypothetical protein
VASDEIKCCCFYARLHGLQAPAAELQGVYPCRRDGDREARSPPPPRSRDCPECILCSFGPLLFLLIDIALSSKPPRPNLTCDGCDRHRLPPVYNIPTADLKRDSSHLTESAREHAPPPADFTGYDDDESSSDDEDEASNGRKPPFRITTAEMDAAIQARLQAADRRIPYPDSPRKGDSLVTPTTFTSPEGGRTYRLPTSSDSPETSDSVRPLTTTEEFDEAILNATQNPQGRQLRSGGVYHVHPGGRCQTVANRR